MVRHFLDLPGARVLPTAGLQLVDQAVGHVVDAAAMGVVHGPAGMGKTYAVESALAARERAGLWSSFPSRPTMRLVAATLFEQLTGSAAGRARSRFVLMDAVIEELSARPRVVVVDEAQRLNTECIEFLRHLHDHPRTRFALLLVGGDGAWQVLSAQPMLRSRVYRRVRLEPLTSEQVLELIPRFHPVYEGVDRELLLQIDDHLAHGNLRDWASFTQSAAALCAEHDIAVLDARVVANAFALHGAAITA
ncbi:ATP-binding protein [Pseudonocardia alni]|jgi:DNA transposition AAA+ family ATPase|uniref:ATP-binding protein n=1 Tax=Pseudonocardia alni TaxID=33907 RepID=UPI0033CE409D